MKPYFLVIELQYFRLIESGVQTCEIRPNNHRGWNTKNIYEGREVTISGGYGKQHRMLKRIAHGDIISDLSAFGVPAWHTVAVEQIYGAGREWLVAWFEEPK